MQNLEEGGNQIMQYQRFQNTMPHEKNSAIYHGFNEQGKDGM
jgi:hypothetical protein